MIPVLWEGQRVDACVCSPRKRQEAGAEDQAVLQERPADPLGSSWGFCLLVDPHFKAVANGQPSSPAVHHLWASVPP